MDVPHLMPDTVLPLATFLPRTHETTDFSKYHNGKLSLSESETSGSQNSQVLYMKGSKRAKRSALSSVGNGPEDLSDGQSDTKEILTRGEEIAWRIVDQEIFEWQYACQTGRPYWWAPESKYTHLKNLQPRLSNEPSPRIWTQDVIDELWKPSYKKQRRAVSEGFAHDPNTVDDLAHLVAIQLLGSCFTLPPEHIAGALSPIYSTWDAKGVLLPDPRMISSLRMHSHFRYSPSFGHQPRNVSPVPLWLGGFDGPSPLTQINFQKNNARESLQRRRGKQRNGMASNSDGGSLDGTIGRESQSTCIVSRNLKSCHTVQLCQDVGRCRHLPFNVSQHGLGPKNGELIEEDGSTQFFNSGAQKPKADYRLESVLRSEPHPVFVQPVKDLVVKRWNSFRRRICSSFSGYTRSEEGSESGKSICSNAGTSIDGRARRRRAQHDSEIDGSTDSILHLNSPASEQVSAPVCDLEATRKKTFDFQLADPFVAAAELVAALSMAENQSTRSQLSDEAFGHLSYASTINAEVQTILHANVAEKLPELQDGQTSSHIKQSTTHSYSTRRSQVRRRRKSMLSEVFTADECSQTALDDEEENVLVGVRSILTSPAEDIEPISPIDQHTPWTETTASLKIFPSE